MSESINDGPTVVLVHGAFADAGSWAPVTERLVAAGIPVTAIVNPLRGVENDAAYVASVINQIPGPVLAVGHSYGGMIITNAVPRTSNVVGLVYVAAFAPDEGETLAGIVGRSKDSVLTTAVLEKQFPTGDGQRPPSSSSSTRHVPRRSSPPTCPSCSPTSTASPSGRSRRARSATRPGTRPGRTCRSGPPSAPQTRPPAPTWSARWPSVPVPTITEIEGSHVIMISQPDAVTDVILAALKAVSG